MCDGVQISHVEAFDAEHGWARVAQCDDVGNFVIKGDEIQSYLLHGTITVLSGCGR
jgi:hypothetical protein